MDDDIIMVIAEVYLYFVFIFLGGLRDTALKVTDLGQQVDSVQITVAVVEDRLEIVQGRIKMYININIPYQPELKCDMPKFSQPKHN